MKNLTGQKFGKWLVLDGSKAEFGKSKLRVKCECGAVKIISRQSALLGTSRMCRKCSRDQVRLPLEDFNIYTWKVLERVKDDPHAMICYCTQCQTVKRLDKASLRRGSIRKCECQRNPVTRLKFFPTWSAMMQRCYNKKDHNFNSYGGRGISVCKAWHDVETFNDWASSHVIPQGHSLDRRNNDGNYTPENCRWASITQQNSNRRMFKSNTSGYPNVNLRPNGLYRVRIHVKGKRIMLGEFETPKKAAEFRNSYIKKNKLATPLTKIEK
jgi:hypothetical protein